MYDNKDLSYRESKLLALLNYITLAFQFSLLLITPIFGFMTPVLITLLILMTLLLTSNLTYIFLKQPNNLAFLRFRWATVYVWVLATFSLAVAGMSLLLKDHKDKFQGELMGAVVLDVVCCGVTIIYDCVFTLVIIDHAKVYHDLMYPESYRRII